MGIWCQTEQELQTHLALDRGVGKRIVTTNGCFDILNYAHVRMLREARAQGDVLVVGLNSDASIQRLKGKERPIRNQIERAEILAALGMVDYVILFEERECIDFVRRVRPDVHVNDASYGENCIEADAVREGGGKLYLLPKFEWESNSQLIQRIRRMEMEKE